MAVSLKRMIIQYWIMIIMKMQSSLTLNQDGIQYVSGKAIWVIQLQISEIA